MLLGSPPDMIRGYPLRETGSAAGGGGVVMKISYHISPRLATGNLQPEKPTAPFPRSGTKSSRPVLILRYSCINSKLKFDSSKNIYKFMLPFL
jgi:hypothetical protein